MTLVAPQNGHFNDVVNPVSPTRPSQFGQWYLTSEPATYPSFALAKKSLYLGLSSLISFTESQ